MTVCQHIEIRTVFDHTIEGGFSGIISHGTYAVRIDGYARFCILVHLVDGLQ